MKTTTRERERERRKKTVREVKIVLGREEGRKGEYRGDV